MADAVQELLERQGIVFLDKFLYEMTKVNRGHFMEANTGSGFFVVSKRDNISTIYIIRVLNEISMIFFGNKT